MASSEFPRQQEGSMTSGPDHIVINRRFSLPRSELRFRASRSGGPGGQHVNTAATRIQLSWDVAGSPSLSERRRQLLLARLAPRLDQEGVLQLAADNHRSQHRNREEAVERLAALLADALRPRKERKATRPPRAAKEKRLREKKQRADVKKLRGRVRDD
jgi:ribosome-associated protein